MVEIRYRTPVDADVAAMAQLAASCQREPEFHVPYLGLRADSIATDIAELTGWQATSMVAEQAGPPGRIIGWLTAEVDQEMGRLWWWGPFIETDSAHWASIADRLYREVRALVSLSVTEEEACADSRSDRLRAWTERHGLVPNTASVLLRRERTDARTDDRVRPLGPADHHVVKHLHDQAFPGTHTTPDALLRSEQPRLVIEVAGEVVGYVAVEIQSDRSGYIDYLAVDPRHRGQGLGRTLVDHGCHDLFAAGASHAHLTVREDNPSARALYGRLGFVEERLARPYRRGFDLA